MVDVTVDQNTTSQSPPQSQQEKVFAATIEILRRQRDANADAIVQLSVQIMGLDDTIKQLEHRLKEQDDHYSSSIIAIKDNCELMKTNLLALYWERINLYYNTFSSVRDQLAHCIENPDDNDMVYVMHKLYKDCNALLNQWQDNTHPAS